MSPEAPIHQPAIHDSAAKHVTGQARYVDDLPTPSNLLHIYVSGASIACGSFRLDLSAVRNHPGAVHVIEAADLQGRNDISPVGMNDDPLMALNRIEFWGQPLFAVASNSIQKARAAAALAEVEYDEQRPQLSIDQAWQNADFVWPVGRMRCGESSKALEQAQNRIRGRLFMGGQDHFYLEGQVSLAIPGEDGDMTVYCSTQHPSEVQHMVAHVLGLPSHAVTVEVRRMGGGFGGKETQANHWACIAALVAAKTGRPAKCRLDRDDDMIMTGKRHDFVVDYQAGFKADGEIQAVEMKFASRCGFSADLSGPINDRALLHADNCYCYPHADLSCYPCRTNTVSNTAFRGFGGPQGMLAAERLIEEIAVRTGLDPLQVRKRNFYDRKDRKTTPYHMEIKDNIILELVEKLEVSSNYWQRRSEVRAFNRRSRWLKRGLALTPVKFGISFTMTAYNQAGALVHIYKDGSIQLNHGGTEMGQGLFIKVAQVVAQELGVDLSRVRISATTTDKVPNTSATAASSGTDLNGMAALNAARTLKERLMSFLAERHQTAVGKVSWKHNDISVDGERITFDQLVHDAYMARIQLSATGFYKTPEIHWDRETGRGRPFYYFAYGAACSQAIIDTLTGEYKIERTDILHDVGRSLNPAIDKGQIEGGFIQGMGWLTTEELVFDEKGRLRTHAPSTYKIPCASDRPEVLNIELMQGAINRENTIHRSKAVGEPPFMLAISVLHALSDAVAAVGEHCIPPELDPPATPEAVLNAVERVRLAHEQL